jgi:hypothetical protein
MHSPTDTQEIYAAPSGHFKLHVNTPRSSSQFGSLVVCLPCDHEGGQLVVRYAQHSHTFDWGGNFAGKNEPAVQWAAFYSDCEHEVLEVTEGYRITLTYNLYRAPGAGDLAGNSTALDTTSVPLFHFVQEVLNRDDFMPDGKLAQYSSTHRYIQQVLTNGRWPPSYLLPTRLRTHPLRQRQCFPRSPQRRRHGGLHSLQRPRSEAASAAILDKDTNEFNYYFEDHEDRHSRIHSTQEYVPPPLACYDVVASMGGHGLTEDIAAEKNM